MIHEPESGKALTAAGRFRDFVRTGGINFDVEADEVAAALNLSSALDEPMRDAVDKWFEDIKLNVETPPPTVNWPSDFSPTGAPMISLRDVEEQVPVLEAQASAGRLQGRLVLRVGLRRREVREALGRRRSVRVAASM